MPRPRLAPPLLLALFALLACAERDDPAGCRSDAQCPEASRCRSGVCAADARPIAALRQPAAVEAFALVELDGSESHDPDAGDGIAEHRWGLRALEAGCAPPEVAGGAAVARVRFGCAGRFEVALAVRDRLGLESEPAAAPVEVLPPRGAPAVTAGPDVATEHLCRGRPLLCRPEDPIVLSAAAPPGVALRWSVEPPPDRPLDGTRRVRFLPGPDAAAPRVELETDGTAISGDWVFRVEARDDYGPMGVAYTRVSIRNRAPLVAVAAPAPVPHVFDPGASAFRASGAVAWAASDPDGDPLSPSATLRHVGDGGATFDGELAGSVVTFEVEVPYDAPEDALLLRGGEGLSRRVEVAVRDANGGEGRAHAEIAVGNRPPEPAGGTVDVDVPHVFDRAGSRYLATARGGAWVDPDGDPLFGGTGAAPCERVTVEGGEARVECSVPYEGTPAADRLAGLRAVAVPVRDPWDLAPGVPTYAVRIGNTPPVVTRVTAPGEVCVTRRYDVWSFDCHAELVVSAVAFDLWPTVVDPEGDPVLLVPLPSAGGSALPTRAVCTGAECVPFRFVQPEAWLRCVTTYDPPSRLWATDGADGALVGATPDPRLCGDVRL